MKNVNVEVNRNDNKWTMGFMDQSLARPWLNRGRSFCGYNLYITRKIEKDRRSFVDCASN